MKIVGKLWNNKEIDIVEIDGEMYALHGWNGDTYNHCWMVLDSQGLNSVEDDKEYTIRPICEGVGKPDEDGYYDEYYVIDYIVEHIN